MHGRCKDCKFWEPHADARIPGTCTLITPNSGYTQTSRAELLPQSTHVKLRTMPDFGCTEFKSPTAHRHSENGEEDKDNFEEFFNAVKNATEI